MLFYNPYILFVIPFKTMLSHVISMISLGFPYSFPIKYGIYLETLAVRALWEAISSTAGTTNTTTTATTTTTTPTATTATTTTCPPSWTWVRWAR